MTKPETKTRSFGAETWDTARTIIGALLIALALRVVVFEPFTIPSDSMEPGLHTGDYVVVSKWDYGWSRHSIPLGLPLFHGRVLERQGPQRGDVIVFKLPRDLTQNYVKRADRRARRPGAGAVGHACSSTTSQSPRATPA